jgi:hypothetical protein
MMAALNGIENEVYRIQQKVKKQQRNFNGHVEGIT